MEGRCILNQELGVWFFNRKAVAMMAAVSAAFLATVPIASSGEVLDPWTPVSVDKKGTETEVGVWGRTYTFGATALPVSIKSQGVELLAGPVRAVCEVAGEKVKWEQGGSWVHQAMPEAVTMASWMEAQNLTINVSTRIEYDGMMKLGFSLIPFMPDRHTSNAKVQRNVDRAFIEIPLKPEAARLFTFFPASWGGVNNSGAVSATPVAYPFKAYFWLGNEDRGLGWFCESEEKFSTASPTNVIEIIPGLTETVLRIRLVDTKTRLPTAVVFGLEATPVKPYPRSDMADHKWHTPEMGVGSRVARPREWWTCQRAFPDKQVEKRLDRAAELGVRTIFFHEDWVPIQNYPFPQPEEGFRAIVDGCHRRGMKVIAYQGHELSPLAPEFAEHYEEYLRFSNENGIDGFWYRAPAQADFGVCYKSAYGKIWLANLTNAVGRLNLDGIYLDGSVKPFGCFNERHGCGWRDAKGELHPTYPIFAVREIIRGMYAALHPKGKIINAHQSLYCGVPTSAFVDSYLDGEQLATEKDGSKIKSMFSLEAFRAEFMGRNHGIPCDFLCYEQPPHFQIEDALAIVLPHDINVRPSGPVALEKVAPVWAVQNRFGITKAKWHPYWEKPSFASAEQEKVIVSGYERDDGAILLVASNLSPGGAVDARITLPRNTASVKDEITGETFAAKDNRVTVPIGSFRVRLLSVANH